MNSSLYMEVAGGKSKDHNSVIQSGVLNANPDRLSQLGKVKALSDGTFSIRPMHDPTMGLSIYNNTVQINGIGDRDNETIITETAQSGVTAIWSITRAAVSGGLSIRPDGNTTKALRVSGESLADGALIVQGNYDNYYFDSWLFEEVTDVTPGVLLYDKETGSRLDSLASRDVAIDRNKGLDDLGIKAICYSATNLAQNVVLSSSSSQIATVDSATQKICGNALGSATIYVRRSDASSSQQAQFTAEIKPKAIIIVPGLMGSQLFADGDIVIPAAGGLDFIATTISDGTRIWDPSTSVTEVISADEKVRALACDSSGSPIYSIRVNDPTINLRDYSENGFQYGAKDIYRNLYNLLYDEFYAENYDIVLYEYDWREDPYSTAQKLSDFIIEQAYGEVTFVSHSMGGLVSSYYLSLWETQRNLVNKHISVGTPYLGASKAPSIYFSGEILSWDAANLYIGGAVVDVAYNIPSVYALFPYEQQFEQYLTYVDAGGNTVDCTTYTQTMNALATYMPNWNSTLATASASSRSRLFVNSSTHITELVDSYYIVGTQRSTIIGVAFEVSDSLSFDSLVVETDPCGDNTVTEQSATIGGLAPAEKIYYKQEYTDPEDSSNNKVSSHIGMISGSSDDTTLDFIVTLIDETVDSYTSPELLSLFGIYK